jgi:hypothetical protein
MASTATRAIPQRKRFITAPGVVDPVSAQLADRMEAQAISVMQPNPFDDIPGTTIFDAQRSRQAYHLNMFCMSLMKAELNGVSSAVLVYTYRSARTLSH